MASRGAPGWSSYWGVARELGTLYDVKIGWLTRAATGTDCVAGSGRSDPRDVFVALDWATKQAPWIKVFNYSYGASVTADDDILAMGFDYLADTYGLTISVSAGNDGWSLFGLFEPTRKVRSPGIGYNVLTVAATNTQGTVDRSDDSTRSRK